MTRLFTVAATLADGDFLQAAGRSRSSSTPPPRAIRFMTEVFILLEVSGAERLYCFVRRQFWGRGGDRPLRPRRGCRNRVRSAALGTQRSVPGRKLRCEWE